MVLFSLIIGLCHQYDLALNGWFVRCMQTHTNLMMLSENKYEGRYQTHSLKMKAGNRCHLVMSSIETSKRVISKQTTYLHTKKMHFMQRKE